MLGSSGHFWGVHGQKSSFWDTCDEEAAPLCSIQKGYVYTNCVDQPSPPHLVHNLLSVDVAMATALQNTCEPRTEQAANAPEDSSVTPESLHGMLSAAT